MVRKRARKNIPNMKLGAVPKYWSILKPRYKKRKEPMAIENP